MQQLFKKLLLSALLILCAPLGFHHAQGGRDGESNDMAGTAETSLRRDLENSETSKRANVARQLQMIPLASYVLFLREYSEIDE
ncbi:MAG TPA: hypothetical protein VF779_04100 [Pyrinomonadaceae bacterium]